MTPQRKSCYQLPHTTGDFLSHRDREKPSRKELQISKMALLCVGWNSTAVRRGVSGTENWEQLTLQYTCVCVASVQEDRRSVDGQTGAWTAMEKWHAWKMKKKRNINEIKEEFPPELSILEYMHIINSLNLDLHLSPSIQAFCPQ